MARGVDHKRYVDRIRNRDFADRVDSWGSSGHIPSFAAVFPETELGHIADSEKSDKYIIQLGFLILNHEGKALLTKRAKFSTKSQHGHTVSTGCSVLVSWSPLDLPCGRRFPASEQDIAELFHKEVPPISNQEPEFRFLGLARNNVRKESGTGVFEMSYFFYLFAAQYGGEPDFSTVSYRKDKDDKPMGFFPIDGSLAQKVADKKVDLRALEAASGSDFSSLGHGESILIRPKPGGLPPFLEHPPGVFISHATSDDMAVDWLADRLRSKGITTLFYDHQAIRSGDDWATRISDAIKYGPCFVVICSKSSSLSLPVQNEVGQAVARKERDSGFLILQIVLEGQDVRDYLPPSLKNLWATDLRDPTTRDAKADSLLLQIQRQVTEYGLPSSPI